MKRSNLWAGIGFLLSMMILSSCSEDSNAGNIPPPTNVLAVAGNGQASVSWKTPSFFSQNPQLYPEYEVQYQGGGGTASICNTWNTQGSCTVGCTTTSVGTTDAATNCTVSGLTNGLSYTFIVVVNVINAVGLGVGYASSNSISPFAAESTQ